ncbi:MAG: hypothetical protein FD146_2499 [Anaerolineaceae bacterium]|nr:MAG: hypothetical protein FD146_2499 [Anaerolineaceae bacterium]
MTLIVLDTNVLVSGLLREESIPGMVVDLVVTRKIRLAVDERIMQEYLDVTMRHRLGIPCARRDEVISQFILESAWVEAHPLPISSERVLDYKDLPFAEVAVAAKVDALVTGNSRHFAFLAEYGVKVLTPAEFAAKF